VRAGILSHPRDVAIAERHVEQSVSIPGETGTVAAGRGSDALIGARPAVIRLRDEDVLYLGERRAAIPSRTHHRGGRVAAAFSGLRVRQIDKAVLREVRVE
jgi:hypothetical protein